MLLFVCRQSEILMMMFGHHETHRTIFGIILSFGLRTLSAGEFTKLNSSTGSHSGFLMGISFTKCSEMTVNHAGNRVRPLNGTPVRARTLTGIATAKKTSNQKEQHNISKMNAEVLEPPNFKGTSEQRDDAVNNPINLTCNIDRHPIVIKNSQIPIWLPYPEKFQ
jgi:hypothetical protein